MSPNERINENKMSLTTTYDTHRPRQNFEKIDRKRDVVVLAANVFLPEHIFNNQAEEG